MGRRVRPYRWVMKSEKGRVGILGRAFSKDNEEVLDRLFDRAKMHGAAILHPEG